MICPVKNTECKIYRLPTQELCELCGLTVVNELTASQRQSKAYMAWLQKEIDMGAIKYKTKGDDE